MTIEQFAKKTGWPMEELESMPFYTVFLPLLALYELEVEFVPLKPLKKYRFCVDEEGF